MKNYAEMLKDDIKNELVNYEIDWNMETDDIIQKMHDDFWDNDNVTGNGCDGYTGIYDSLTAEEMVKANAEQVMEALVEFGASMEECAKNFVDGNYKWLDITARCYWLWKAVADVVIELCGWEV